MMKRDWKMKFQCRLFWVAQITLTLKGHHTVGSLAFICEAEVDKDWFYLAKYIQHEKALIKMAQYYILMLLDSNWTVQNTKTSKYIRVDKKQGLPVQYCDNIKNEEYNFISGTFINNCNLHCIQLEESNWHFRSVWQISKRFKNLQVKIESIFKSVHQ